MSGSAASQSFIQAVQWALRHLYDPAELRKSALLQMLNLNQHDDPLSALHAIIMEAIQALKPGANVPLQAHAWRVYHILFHRYAEQFTQRQVATDLALSIRQLRRQEDLAVEVLADYLWNRYDLRNAPTSLLPAANDVTTAAVDAPTREQELNWLKRTFPSEATDIAQAIRSVLQTVDPMIRVLGVSVQCDVPDHLPPAAVPPTTLRQALLNALTAAVRSVPHQRVSLTATAQATAVRVSISAMTESAVPQAYPEDYADSLEMARQLTELSGGSFELAAQPSEHVLFTAGLALPIMRNVEVLVIDDNLDTLHLFEDYLTGTRYHVSGTSDPQQALRLIEEKPFQVIILDVMLPGIDGWELLGRLREHPATRGVPILVCTIMPQEGLALTLGAAAFQRKPVSRAALLSTLDRLTSASAGER
jgi:CheY-like chemotaxis protein